MKCISCTKFKSLKKHNNSLNGSYWLCDEKTIYADSDGCQDFVLYHVIVCPKKNKFRQISVTVCLHYQKEKKCKCKKGLEIKHYISKQPVKLIKRKKPCLIQS